ncbi:MAG: acyl-CoA thioesterase [Gammaproteobacteria bacterium]|nr:acyl-CoA thioesterase [Gammaproteobacteria bacterium]
MTNIEKPCAEVIIEIPFHDVDSAFVAWHGHYAKYFELARCSLLDSIDYNYRQMCDSGYFWPVIDMQVRYIQSARFQQKIVVRATLEEWENRMLIKYLIRDLESGQRLSKGRTIQVAVRMDTGEMQFASPDIFLKKLNLIES